MKTQSTQTRNSIIIKIISFFTILISLSALVLICVWFVGIAGYLINSKSEKTEKYISADLGGGLFMGASASSLQQDYKFGNSDSAFSGFHYETTIYTKLFGKRFDKAEVSFSASYSPTFSLQGDKLDGMKLEKGGTTKEVRQFAKDLVSNLRKEAELPNNESFYQHYTLVTPDMIIEMKYEGFFKHYLTLGLIQR